MQETPADRLLPIVVERMKGGTDLREFVAAAALANARAFGGQDYDGYHALDGAAALVPDVAGAARVAAGPARPEGALPQHEPHPADGRPVARDAPPGRAAAPRRRPVRRPRPSARPTRRQDMDGAERTFAAMAARAARRGVQRPPVPRPGQHQRPPGRPGLAGLGVARPHRQGARPHPAPPVGPVLRGRGEEHPQVHLARTRCGPSCPGCSTSTGCWAAPRAIGSRTTPGSSS